MILTSVAFEKAIEDTGLSTWRRDLLTTKYGTRSVQETRQKLIVHLRRLGYSHEQIAKRMGINRSTVTHLLKKHKV